ncbi:MAG: glycogen debranching protein GlgX [Bacteroidetes bacterium]|nr:glycogen debranching protein GlgX [Bacteroidota bacterium]
MPHPDHVAAAGAPPTADDIKPGIPLPLGAYLHEGGANFSLFSRHASCVFLEFYDHPASAEPTRRIELTPTDHRTGDTWHVWVEGITSGQLYGYRVDGPYRPEDGHRFNPNKLLIDPYAAAITHLEGWDFRAAHGYAGEAPQQDLSFSEIDNAGSAPKCVLSNHHFDWSEDPRPDHPWSETVIYELHVRGFTRHPTAAVDHPGTYRGLIEKIPYLQDLGVTVVELMPVQEFNEHEIPRTNPQTGEPLRNFWGYNPAAFMAPNGTYSSAGTSGEQIRAFKEMVLAFHQADIEVILDVVFNHTAEGNELGPTICWRGIDNSVYYILDDDPRFYKDFTGTGNTFKVDHPIARDLILDALRYWVMEMHVDGFRFDLASVLGRDETGHLLADPPLIERIAEDPVLREAKIIAEAWDPAGAYQVGSFYDRRWAEWNGRFRDDVRRFWRGDDDVRAAFAHRLAGSDDLYRASGKGPESSINYVTCHDGFTLHDLVSYARKHNEANGEFNRDGPDANYSANYGVEGETDDAAIQATRTRQIKNFVLTLFLSRGVPMLLGGDEFRRTQGGNNNAYCQDNEISWVNWDRLDEHTGLHRFVRHMIAFRRSHSVFRKEAFYNEGDIAWYDPDGQPPEWSAPTTHRLAGLVRSAKTGAFYLLFNPDSEAASFTLPPAPDEHAWHLKVDTAAPSPSDILDDGAERLLENQQNYGVESRSSVLLMALTASPP